MPDHDSVHQEGSLAGTARGRVAHLLCGLHRAMAADQAGRGSVILPPIMAATASALGLTPIHLVLTLRHLAAEGFIATDGRTVDILDVQRLEELAKPHSL